MSQPRLSVVIVAYNEADNIRACLDSVAWAEQRVVVDSGSTDGTVDIARTAGAEVLSTDWPGFGPQKNRAIQQARGRWVLSIDADERVTPELRAQIEDALSSADASIGAFELPRRSSFCGHWMAHGGWWPDHVTRLFRNGSARFSDDAVHERLLVDGNIGRLSQPLLHYTYRTLEQALQKLDRYSTLGARQAFAAGKRATPLTAIARGGWAFFRTYFLRLGLLDGWAGLMLAAYNGHTTYYRYLKLWLLCRGATQSGSGQHLS
ncbi:MAG: glycosyltransferase involved in cell wall biosis [Nevskia sp.]|nr:glycosyltransferase involved in cell wall biosis [Nevskia sp.]